MTWAIGGVITEIGGKRIHTFTANGTLTVIVGGQVEYLVVGGGGGGGHSLEAARSGGGGGAGGFRTATGFVVSTGDIPVTVGAAVGVHVQGNNSIFSSITSLGGGRGGYGSSANPGEAGAVGGSGGGGGARWGPPGAGTAGQGNIGSFATDWWGGGGGGAGAAGTNPNGGAGLSSSISGAAVWYAGGGGGGDDVSLGGQGGGGNGANGLTGTPATAGTDGLGGGGGGAQSPTNPAAGGGSGIVIISYVPTPPAARILHYLLDVNDPRQLIRDQFDREVPPEELRPNKWLAIVGWQSPSALIPADFIDDPEKVPISSVRFTEPDDYSLGSGTDDLLDSVIARLTQRSA